MLDKACSKNIADFFIDLSDKRETETITFCLLCITYKVSQLFLELGLMSYNEVHHQVW